MRFLLSLLLLASYCLPVCLGDFALQSGPENGGDSVAGGVHYDPYRNALYITGATTGSYFGEQDPSDTNCFLGTIRLEDDIPDEARWWTVRTLGNSDVPESCSSLIRFNEEDQLFVAGASLEGGLLSDLRARGSLKSTVYGMLIELNLAAAVDADTSYAVVGGNLMHQSHVQYPIAMDMDDEYVYVATIVSEDSSKNKYYEPFVPQEYGYGSAYSVQVERYRMTEPLNGETDIQQTLLPSWDRRIGTAEHDVYVGGLLYMSGSSLVLAGTTQGSDSAFPDDNPGTDMDGFVTELDPTTGQLTGNSYRIESQLGRTDRIYGVCKAYGEEQDFYVVGVTTGNLESDQERNPQTEQAFIVKMEVATSRGFSVVWMKQLGATTLPADDGSSGGTQGMACAVPDDGSVVYIVGRVDDGAAMNGDVAAGGKDVFVAQLDPILGNTNWIHQFGSAADDYVTDVATDGDGNALVYGTTLGTLYRDNPGGEQDVFVVVHDKNDGTYVEPINGTPTATTTTTAPAPTTTTTAPAPTPAGATTTSTTTAPAPTEGTTTTAAPQPTTAAPQPTEPAPAPTEAAPTPTAATTAAAPAPSGKGKGGKIAISLILIIITVVLALFLYRRHKYSKDVYSDEDHVVEYLKGFDDVEVDLKQSATGGWHGTYLNPRYASNETYSYNAESTGAALQFDGESSYVRNSLFMDDYETPSLGTGEEEDDGDERQGLTKQRSNYDGLVDAYNTTWDDLSPHVMPTSRPEPKRDLSDKKHVMETIDFMRDDDAWGKEIV